MIVVDASVLAPAPADDGTDGDVARARLRGEALAAPELIDVGVPSVPRRSVRGRLLPLRRAESAPAEQLDAVLVTADGPLSRAAGPRCAIELLTAERP